MGGPGKLLQVIERVHPRLLDVYMLLGDRMVKEQLADDPADARDNLFGPLPSPGSTRGRFGRGAKSTSLYTRLFELRPIPVKAVLLGLAARSLTLWRLASR